MMKRVKSRFKIVLAVIFASLFFITGCNGGANTPPQELTVDAWSAPITEKVLQDYFEYSDIKTAAKVEIFAAKGDYESAQVILTPSKDVSEYDVSVSDLRQVGGSEVLQKENLEVFNQKYIRIEASFTKRPNAPLGMYPDALLPFQTAKEYRENKIASGKNQGIWFTYNIPRDQAPGEYTGTFEISVDGKKIDVPVSVTVWDYEISKKVNAKTIFQIQYTNHSGDLDSSKENIASYIEEMLKFRVSPNYFLQEVGSSDIAIKNYVDLIYDYAIRDELSTYQIPTKSVTQIYKGRSEQNVDKEFLAKYLNALVDKSVATKFNMLDKLILRLGALIDEPSPVKYDRVELVTATVEATLTSVADKLNNRTDINDDEFQSELVASIRGVKHGVTTRYNDELKDSIKTWIPLYDAYNTPEERAQYADQEERWWYGCNNPSHPYPTYHIDDNLLSSRVLSWMQADYNVVGNLYWAVNFYPIQEPAGGHLVPNEDYYATANRFPTSNGEGFLFYPGKPYGLKTPVSSIRMHSIRDGMEEYETLIALEQKYESFAQKYGASVNAEKVLRQLYDTLYSGTKVQTNSELFFEARQNLTNLTLLAASDAEVAIGDVQADTNKIVYTIYAKDGFTLKNDGEVVEGVATTGGKKYTVVVKLENAINKLALSVEKDGVTIGSVTINAGGKIDSLSAEEIQDYVSVLNDGEVILTDALGEPSLQLMLPQADESVQRMTFEGDVLNNIGINTNKITFVIHNSSNTPLAYELRFRHANKNLDDVITTGILRSGDNEVSVSNLYSYQWDKIGNLKSIKISFGAAGDLARDNVYLRGFRYSHM